MRTKKIRRAFLAGIFLTVTALTLLLPSGAQALTDGWQITEFELVATVRSSGVVEVDISFVYDFGNEPGHGPYFEFIRKQGYDSNNDRLYEYRNFRVSSPTGAPADLFIQENAWNVLVRVGDPDVGDVSGAHTYVLSYELTGMLNDDSSTGSGMDELYWNVIGSTWQIPISNVSVRIQDDFGADLRASDCFTGPSGATESCSMNVVSGGAAVFQQDEIPVGNQFTVVAGWAAETWSGGPDDGIAPILVSAGSSGTGGPLSQLPTNQIAIVLALLVALGGSFKLARDVRRTRFDDAYVGVIHGQLPRPGDPVRITKRDPAAPVAVQFNPPPGLSPAEAGVLIDESADKGEFAATLIDLAVRGYLTISEVPPSHLMGESRDWLLTPTGVSLAGLAPHEHHLLSSLLPTGPVHLSSLRQSSDLAEIYIEHNSLVNGLMESRGLFHQDPGKARGSWVKKGAVFALTAILLIFVSVVWATSGGGLHVFWLPIVFLGLSIATFMTAKYAPVRTATGSALLAQTAGFEQYLSVAEANQLRFEENEDIFSRYLPYAVAFGNAERWTTLLSSVIRQGASATASWYIGADRGTGFSDSLVIYSLVDSISDTTQRSVQIRVAENSSTSGSGGGSGFSGGSSGGGGGGGGGGGW